MCVVAIPAEVEELLASITFMSDPRTHSPITSSAKPVLISGAGLGGLLLDQSLRSHRIPFRLYERDTDGSSRSQGYRLSISVDGLTALEQVLDPVHHERFRAGCTDLGGGTIQALDAIT